MASRDHWEHIYQSKGDAELSWHQDSAATSLRLFDRIAPMPGSVADIGGGQSAFAPDLIARGVPVVMVIDIAQAALDRSRARAGPLANRITWFRADITDPATTIPPVDLWHDRAVFHFLTEQAARDRYTAAVARAVQPGGHAIIATFAPDGPPRCSGLDVRRYDAEALAAELAPAFSLNDHTAETHTTPWGAAQRFTYVLLRRATE